VKHKKGLKIFLIVFLCVVFISGILIYETGRKDPWKGSQKNFDDKNEEEMELVNNLELLENYDVITNLDFFEDITKEGE
jgi:hypothetical protein